MARKKTKQKQETTLVLHRTPSLQVLLDRAKFGDSAQAVRAYLGAGGSPVVLVHSGADSNTISAEDGCTALTRAAKRNCCTELLLAFLQNSADVMIFPSSGFTALHQAATHGCTESCKALLSRDSGLLHVKDALGCTALMCAVAAGRLDTVKFLLQLGADISILYAASSLQRVPVVLYLLKAGADVNAVDNGNESALMAAAQCNSEDVV
eukprot:4572-Heterococcus_DN1.PRE.4